MGLTMMQHRKMAYWLFGVVEPSLRFCDDDLQVLMANRRDK